MVTGTVHALVSAKHRAFAVPFDQALANIVPEAREIQHPNNGRMLVLPHTRDTTKLSRNLGYPTPAPILTQYDWNGDTPFRTQRITAALLTMQPRAYVLSQMGTGKTRAALHAINYMLMTGEILRALIVAPLSTLQVVWGREILQHFSHLSVGVLHGTRIQRQKVLAEKHDIYVINHDGVETILPALMDPRNNIGCVVIDELAAFRNARTDRWKAVNTLIQQRPYVWGLTGSPTPNEPADAWAQCRLLTPHTVPKFYKQFKRQTMMQVSQFRWVAKKEANEIVHAAMQPGVRYTRDQCVELPDVIYQSRSVQLSQEQSRVYKGLMAKLKLAFAEGTVTAANEGVLFSKLLQIACGWVYTTDRRVVSLDNQDRVDQLLEVIDEAEGKVIVFVEFVHAAQELLEILLKAKVDAALVTGNTPPSVRNTIFSEFQRSPTPRVLVAHPKCMAHGLTLVAANVIVWFCPSTSLETYEQACARITRPGQTRKSFIVHLTGTAIETKIYHRLQQRASLQGALLGMFESQEHEA